jgi:hypothetical protein
MLHAKTKCSVFREVGFGEFHCITYIYIMNLYIYQEAVFLIPIHKIMAKENDKGKGMIFNRYTES